MAYAFEFAAWDNMQTDDDGYRSRKNQVTVTVVADDEEGALKAVKELVIRENYLLNIIREMTEKNTAGE